MSRWISANYLKRLIENNRLLQGNCEYTLWEQEADRIVDSQPSIDIVRCGECKQWQSDGGALMLCEVTEIPTDADDFCSYGEKR